MKKTNYKIIKGIFIFSILFFSSCQKDKDIVTITPLPSDAETRVYYIAAEEVVWDYAPSDSNVFMGIPFDANDSVYTVNLPANPTPRIGRKNKKARYIAYTDSTFTTAKSISPEWEHLGILGPVIRANVGDSVLVYFKNKTSVNASIHVHGLLYDAHSEGSPYNNGANGDGSSIAPGGKYRYQYYAREGSGPASAQASSVVWLYHSHVNMDESDLYSGLVGAIIVTKKGMGDANAKPTDVDREFITLFFIWNENNSLYLSQNTNTYCPGFANPSPDDFEESNKKHCINGMLMGNLPGLTMNKGERVRWYVMGLGNEVDLHTPHRHGNTVTISGQNTDVIEILPAAMVVADMKPDNAGTWAYHCHVTDHMVAGMTALYKVQ